MNVLTIAMVRADSRWGPQLDAAANSREHQMILNQACKEYGVDHITWGEADGGEPPVLAQVPELAGAWYEGD